MSKKGALYTCLGATLLLLFLLALAGLFAWALYSVNAGQSPNTPILIGLICACSMSLIGVVHCAAQTHMCRKERSRPVYIDGDHPLEEGL